MVLLIHLKNLGIGVLGSNKIIDNMVSAQNILKLSKDISGSM